MSQIASGRTDRLNVVGAVALAITALIHLVLVIQYFSDVLYLGVLWLVAAVASAYLAWRLGTRGDDTAWLAGSVLSAGLIVGLVASRWIGLPDFHVTVWGVRQVVALISEGVVVAAWPIHAARHGGFAPPTETQGA
jgi:hypothetical protein